VIQIVLAENLWDEIEACIALLAPIYNYWTGVFDTRDLKEAKALLAELQ
jgi:hypothetical protein